MQQAYESYGVLSHRSWQVVISTSSTGGKRNYSVPRNTRLRPGWTNYYLMEATKRMCQPGNCFQERAKLERQWYVALIGRMGIAGWWMCIPAFHQYYLLLAMLWHRCVTPSLYPSSIFLCLYWKLNGVTFLSVASQWISRNQGTRPSASVLWVYLICTHISWYLLFSFLYALGDFGEGVGHNRVRRQRISLRPQNWPRCLSSRVSH